MLSDKSILVADGIGSFVKAFVNSVLLSYPTIKRIIDFLRNKLKPLKMARQYPKKQYQAPLPPIGNIRDESRLRHAPGKKQIAIHTAAFKQLPAAKHNPFECINFYGAIKLCSDKRFVTANNFGSYRDLRFSVLH